MGCDIHSISQKCVDGKWEDCGFSPFDWRSYGMYGFLADVRNYSAIPPIAPQRGLPDGILTNYGDPSEEGRLDLGDHSFSWLTVDELTSFDYDQPVEDRRFTRQEGPNYFNGAATAEPGQGKMTTYREFLGESFFRDLQKLKELGAERIIFGFDS